MPFERPGYRIYSPEGEGWLFVESDQLGQYNMVFGLPQKSRTHTLYARIVEVPSDATFDSPKDFQSFIQKQNKIGSDPHRYKIVKEEYQFDSKFGDYSISHYSLVEDHGAYQLDDAPYLLMETMYYKFIHPHNKKHIISVIYSERGKPNELDGHFKEKAKAFIYGLNLKK